MNNDNDHNVNGQPGVVPPYDSQQSNPGSVSGAAETVSPQTQNVIPDVTAASQVTEPIPNQSIPNQPIPNQSIPNQPSMTNQEPMPEQPQQNAAPQGGSAPQPQYQPGPQQAAPSQGMNGQQQYQYQSQFQSSIPIPRASANTAPGGGIHRIRNCMGNRKGREWSGGQGLDKVPPPIHRERTEKAGQSARLRTTGLFDGTGRNA